MKVPFQNLAAHHAPHRADLLATLEEVIDASEFAGGRFVGLFEEQFAAYCRCRHAVGVASGTDALWLALSALGIGPGDEVITVPTTFIATCEAISRTGARPVFVDVDPESYTMDPGRLQHALSPRTKAIVPVHLFGQMAAMEEIMEFGRANGLWVVEDAAQAHGAEYRGLRAGSVGDVGCFSFYPAKNLGALGEAGIVVTSDEQLAQRVRMTGNHGQWIKGHHSVIGWNCRMDGLQGAVLRLKLRHLDRNNRRRREIAGIYTKELADVPGVVVPAVAEHRVHAYHSYAVRVSGREQFIRHLEDSGVGCAIQYPVAVHRQPSYAHLGLGEGSFPVAERCANEFVSLPMYPELTSHQINAVTTAVREAVSRTAAA